MNLRLIENPIENRLEIWRGRGPRRASKRDPMQLIAFCSMDDDQRSPLSWNFDGLSEDITNEEFAKLQAFADAWQFASRLF